MSGSVNAAAAAHNKLRLWPGILIVALQWIVWQIVPRLVPSVAVGYAAAMAAMAGGVLVLLWWLFFSRAAWLERLGAVALIVAALWLLPWFLHESVATAGMGMMIYIYVVPWLSLAFVVWAVLTRATSDRLRRLTMVATILLACGSWALLRTSGVVGLAGVDLAWRWEPTAEERLLARAEEPSPEAVAATATAAPEWPGFRGPRRDGVAVAAPIATDWSTTPPRELWRRPIGPGWSSFALHGGFLFTQEQRGDREVVSCYRAADGEPVWRHENETRFWEANAGAGPRGTPTLAGGRVYSFGATGILDALAAADGARLWSRDVAADTGVEVPYWGFSSSPLLAGDSVVVAAEGVLAGYDAATGAKRWQGPAGGGGYSSPHLVTVDGVEQVLLLSASGATSVDPASGEVLWRHEWSGFPITQPAVLAGGDLLINGGQSLGVRRLAVRRGGDGWKTEERWTSNRLKPYFNDLVVHEGTAYGFDGTLLAAIDVETGERLWKGGRYGQGQLVLLPDQDLLLVVSEKGELALVTASADGFEELARLPALEGKTWNHPVVVGELLLLRNGREMAAYRLPAAG